MAFQIFAIVPRYDNRDACVGSTAHAMPNTYQTVTCARAIAARMGSQNDETGYVVVPFGTSPFIRMEWPVSNDLDAGNWDCPF